MSTTTKTTRRNIGEAEGFLVEAFILITIDGYPVIVRNAKAENRYSTEMLQGVYRTDIIPKLEEKITKSLKRSNALRITGEPTLFCELNGRNKTLLWVEAEVDPSAVGIIATERITPSNKEETYNRYDLDQEEREVFDRFFYLFDNGKARELEDWSFSSDDPMKMGSFLWKNIIFWQKGDFWDNLSYRK